MSRIELTDWTGRTLSMERVGFREAGHDLQMVKVKIGTDGQQVQLTPQQANDIATWIFATETP